MREKIAVSKITWHFSPPADPEAGGVWERGIRTVKETLRLILKEQRPRYEVLMTLLCEVEKIMNSTPLTHGSVDPTDDDVLTPFYFFHRKSDNVIPCWNGRAGRRLEEEVAVRTNTGGPLLASLDARILTSFRQAIEVAEQHAECGNR